MDIGFFFEYNNTVVQLPINPEKISVKYAGNNKSTEIIKLGEITLLKDAKLASMSFSSWFPYANWFPGIRTSSQFEEPTFYKDFFNGIQNDKQPVRFIVTGLDINFLVSVESFTYTHQAGDHEDAYYDIELKEYREYGIEEIPVDESLKRKVKKPKKPSGSSKPTSITIGTSVIVNGRLHYNSLGAKPGKTLSNYKGKINFINKQGSHPYHVTTPSGGWLGWVTEGSVDIA